MTTWQNRITRYSEEAPDQLLANPRNWRTHPGSQADVLRDVLGSVGIVQNVIANERSGYLVDGHLRVMEALKAGQASIPVTWVDLSEEEEALVLATLDPISALAGADPAALDAILREIPDASPAIAQMLDELAQSVGIVPGVGEAGAGGDEFDATPDEGPTRCALGDLWLIDGGRHRIIVGDSTDPATVARLMQGERAQTTLTDQPYNVGIDYDNGTTDTKADYEEFNRKWFSLCPSDCIVFTPGTVNLGLWYRIKPPKWICVWRKTNQASPSGLQGFNTWEPLLVYGKQPKPVGQDSWDIPVKQEMDREHPEHPVAKTLEAWQTFLEAFSTGGAIVYDAFLGSGTTLIAAHRTGRRCYGVELAPRYGDVILRRAETEGLTVERAE